MQRRCSLLRLGNPDVRLSSRFCVYELLQGHCRGGGSAALCVLSGAMAVLLLGNSSRRQCSWSGTAGSAAALHRLASWLALEQRLPFVAQQAALQQRRSSHCPRLAVMRGLEQVLPVIAHGTCHAQNQNQQRLRRCLRLSLSALGHGAARGRRHGCVKVGRRRHSHTGQGSPYLSPCGPRAAPGATQRRSSKQGLSPCIRRALAHQGQGLPPERPAGTSLRRTQLATHHIDCLMRHDYLCLTCRARVKRAEHQGSEFREQSQRQASRGPDVLSRWQPCSKCGSDCSHCSTRGGKAPPVGPLPVARAGLRNSCRPPPQGQMSVQKAMPQPGASSRACCSACQFLATAC